MADLVTITFPQKPETLDTLGNNTAQFIDSTAIYSIITRERNPDEELPLHSDKLAEYYESFIKGFLGSSKGRLISKKPFEIDGFKGIEIEFMATGNPNLPDLRFARFIYLDHTIITANFMTWSENREMTQTSRTQFLNSLSITADKTTLSQGVDDPKTYAIAYMLGKAAGWAIVLGVIAGLILLVRKITTRKKKIKQDTPTHFQ